jgi:hypothetical protein
MKSKKQFVAMKASRVVEAYEKGSSYVTRRDAKGAWRSAGPLNPAKDLNILWFPGVLYRVTYEVVGFNPDVKLSDGGELVSSPWNGSAKELMKRARACIRSCKKQGRPKKDYEWALDVIRDARNVVVFMKAIPGLRREVKKLTGKAFVRQGDPWDNG